jgi:hypothetical protein
MSGFKHHALTPPYIPCGYLTLTDSKLVPITRALGSRRLVETNS